MEKTAIKITYLTNPSRPLENRDIFDDCWNKTIELKRSGQAAYSEPALVHAGKIFFVTKGSRSLEH